jgi:hypothetical protein
MEDARLSVIGKLALGRQLGFLHELKGKPDKMIFKVANQSNVIVQTDNYVYLLERSDQIAIHDANVQGRAFLVFTKPGPPGKKVVSLEKIYKITFSKNNSYWIRKEAETESTLDTAPNAKNENVRCYEDDSELDDDEEEEDDDEEDDDEEDDL